MIEYYKLSNKDKKDYICLKGFKNKFKDRVDNDLLYSELISVLLKLDKQNIIELCVKSNNTGKTYYINKNEISNIFKHKQEELF